MRAGSVFLESRRQEKTALPLNLTRLLAWYPGFADLPNRGLPYFLHRIQENPSFVKCNSDKIRLTFVKKTAARQHEAFSCP